MAAVKYLCLMRIEDFAGEDERKVCVFCCNIKVELKFPPRAE